VDGPFHFWLNRPHCPRGPTLLKRAILSHLPSNTSHSISSEGGVRGYWGGVLSVHHAEWAEAERIDRSPPPPLPTTPARQRGKKRRQPQEAVRQEGGERRRGLLEKLVRQAGLDPGQYFRTEGSEDRAGRD
jgi:hypothetical protein